MLLIYPTLGIDAFEVAALDPAPAAEAMNSSLTSVGSGRGRETEDGFVVLAGSRARVDEVASAKPWLREQRSRLVARGVLKRDGEHLVFTQDFRFSSSSTAAAVLVGGSANGRRAWKTPEGRMLRDLQDERAES